MRIMTGLFVAGLLATSLAVADHPAFLDGMEGPADGGKVQADLTEQMAKGHADQFHRVIVSLADSTAHGADRGRAIAAAQERVINAFGAANSGRGLTVLTRYQTLFGFSAELTAGQVIALSNRPDVTFVEVMPVHEKLYNESFPLADVDLAQAGGYDGMGSVLAIIDDGIDAAHPAFTGKYLGGYDFADNDSDPTIDCSGQSHGTAVTGVALGNGGGSLGVAPGADFVFLKIQSAGICGSSSLDGDVVGAIDWAVANKDTYGIDIISMSLGGGSYSSESSCDNSSSIYFNAVQNAVNANITVIAASGNDGLCDAMSRPACFSPVISVGAVYDDALGNLGWCVSRQTCANASPNPGCPRGMRAAFEDAFADNVIVYSNSATFLDIVAPSTCATSAAPNNGTTNCFGGTSSATPFSAGVAALAVESAGKGALTPANMRALLGDTGDAVTDPKNGRISPRVNANQTVADAPNYVGNNLPPTASFTYNCTELNCSFDGSGSSDSDGTITAYSWDFGDGNGGSGVNPNHSYATDGTYTVVLTVTDNDGATGNDSQDVTVSSNTGGFTLSTNGYKVKGKHTVDLTWSGANSTNVDIYRDGTLVTTTANDGAHTDNIGAKGGATYVYQVCEAGTSTCSNTSTVIF